MKNRLTLNCCDSEIMLGYKKRNYNLLIHLPCLLEGPDYMIYFIQTKRRFSYLVIFGKVKKFMLQLNIDMVICSLMNMKNNDCHQHMLFSSP